MTDTIVSIELAVSDSTFIISPVSSTSFWSPPTATSAPPSKTSAFLTTKKCAVPELSYTLILTFIGLVLVTFAQVSPITVVVVPLGTVYTEASDVPVAAAAAFFS